MGDYITYGWFNMTGGLIVVQIMVNDGKYGD